MEETRDGVGGVAAVEWSELKRYASSVFLFNKLSDLRPLAVLKKPWGHETLSNNLYCTVNLTFLMLLNLIPHNMESKSYLDF